jgi:hypothetical protein
MVLEWVFTISTTDMVPGAFLQPICFNPFMKHNRIHSVEVLLSQQCIGAADLRSDDFTRDDDLNTAVLLATRGRVIACHRV